MAVTSISIVCTVFVLKLHHCCPHERPVPAWLRRVVPRRLSDRGDPGHTDRYRRNQPVMRPLQTISARTTRGPISGADEVARLVGKISAAAAERNVDDGQSTTSPADCAAHGDWRSSSTSADYGPMGGYNPAVDGAPTMPPTGAGRPPSDRAEITRRLAVIEEMIGQLATILTKKDDDEEDSQVAADWRGLAAFADRCLFWIFLVITAIYTVTTMVLVPFYIQ